ncbi:MAG: hypothetical protein KAR79_06155, partial [Simkaniaceae bacterium]|nr:hypothetical protein [Simkaniaceae bacterium]
NFLELKDRINCEEQIVGSVLRDGSALEGLDRAKLLCDQLNTDIAGELSSRAGRVADVAVDHFPSNGEVASDLPPTDDEIHSASRQLVYFHKLVERAKGEIGVYEGRISQLVHFQKIVELARREMGNNVDKISQLEDSSRNVGDAFIKYASIASNFVQFDAEDERGVLNFWAEQAIESNKSILKQLMNLSESDESEFSDPETWIKLSCIIMDFNPIAGFLVAIDGFNRVLGTCSEYSKDESFWAIHEQCTLFIPKGLKPGRVDMTEGEKKEMSKDFEVTFLKYLTRSLEKDVFPESLSSTFPEALYTEDELKFQVWSLLGCPLEIESSKVNLFENKEKILDAIRNIFREKVRSLSAENQNKLDGLVYEFSKEKCEESGRELNTYGDSSWGRNHRYDDIAVFWKAFSSLDRS